MLPVGWFCAKCGCAEGAPGEQHYRLSEIDEPELAHEEIEKMNVQLTAAIGVVELVIGDRYGQANIEALRFMTVATKRASADASALAGRSPSSIAR